MMKKLAEKISKKLPDEMEKSIFLKSIKIAWIYSVAFLLVWSLYESYKVYQFHEKLNLLPCLLLVSQNIVLISCRLFFCHNMVKGEDEERNKKHWQWIAIIIAILIVMLIVISITFSLINKVMP